MEPVDFILQLQGIAKVLKPDEVPTLEQWKAIHEMLGETMKTLVVQRIKELERKDKYDAWRQQEFKYAYSPNFGGTVTMGTGTATFGIPSTFTPAAGNSSSALDSFLKNKP